MPSVHPLLSPQVTMRSSFKLDPRGTGKKCLVAEGMDLRSFWNIRVPPGLRRKHGSVMGRKEETMFSARNAEQKNGTEYDRRFHDIPPSHPPISHILHGCATYLKRNRTTSPHLGNSSTQYIPRGYRSTNGANAFGDVFSFWRQTEICALMSHTVGFPIAPERHYPQIHHGRKEHIQWHPYTS